VEMATLEGHESLARAEYDRLVAAGAFEDERVELLFGMVVPMTPIDPEHAKLTREIGRRIELQLRGRAAVCNQSSFAASDISEPQPDVMVVPLDQDRWDEHPMRALLVVEVSRSSLRRDIVTKAALYGLAEVDEHWIVDHVHEVVVVHRDRRAGKWHAITTHARGETIAMLAFPDVAIAVSEILPPVGS
jgi:Uma2 family endonuclease